MCECLDYEDGDRYQCPVCADISREAEARLARLEEALPSEEDECPCCLTHSCEAFRAYVSVARAALAEAS